MLVEDHAAFRQSLAALLSQEPDLEVVAQAGSLAQARGMLDTRLDVAVLDLSLPDGDGRDLIGELRRRNAGISVLVLTVMLGPGHLDEVLKAGADAVLHKVASPPTIVEEVRRLGGSVATPSTTTAGAGFRELLTTAELRRKPLLRGSVNWVPSRCRPRGHFSLTLHSGYRGTAKWSRAPLRRSPPVQEGLCIVRIISASSSENASASFRLMCLSAT